MKFLRRLFRPKSKAVDNVEVRITSSMTFEEPTRGAPLPPITLISADCPYCGVQIDPPPTRRKKCPHCAETIYTYTNQEARKKTLLTTRSVERLERQHWDEEWHRLNAEVVEAYTTGDWDSAQIAHLNQAAVLFDRGRDHRQSARLSRQDELRGFQTLSHTYSDKVMVESNGCCDVCASKDGLIITIAEALKRNPIPHDDCQSMRDKNEFDGWCRCHYTNIIGTVCMAQDHIPN